MENTMKTNSPQLPLNPNELILKILSRSPWGLPAAKIRQSLPSSYRSSTPQIEERLKELRERGRAQEWQPPEGKTQKAPGAIYSEKVLAETLLGKGDLLFKDLGRASRLQAPLISDLALKKAARC
jgi:hypothetical protein